MRHSKLKNQFACVLLAATLAAACNQQEPLGDDATSAASTTSDAGLVDIGSVTLDDLGCSLDIAEQLDTGMLGLTAHNRTGAQAAFEVFRLREGHVFEELVAHVEEERALADAGQPFVGPPGAAASFASPGSGILDAGESGTVEIDAGQDGIYAVLCLRHHEMTSDPVRPFALLGPLRIGDAEAALSPRGYQVMVGVDEEIGVLMAGGVTGSPPIGSFTLDDAWSFRASEGWINLVESGVPIFGTAAAYDAQSRRVIVVGDETWSYDPDANSWQTQNPQVQPPDALGGTAAYDVGSDRVILFNTTGETWVYDYDSDRWSEMALPVRPSNRDFSTMAYDDESDRVVLFGGWRNQNDTWAYDYETNTWTDMAPSDPPPGRQYAAMVYDPATDRAILFGGAADPGNTALGDTWAYDYNTNTWTEIRTDVAPEARGRHAMAYNPADGTIVLFGGGFGSAWENRPAGTWIFDPSTDMWQEIP